MRMKRSTGASRIASSRICVPSTFVVTNSRAPSAIDFSTCDSAAALTITSTSDTTSKENEYLATARILYRVAATARGPTRGRCYSGFRSREGARVAKGSGL